MNFILISIVLSVLATVLFRFFRKRYPNVLQPFPKKGKTRAVRQAPRIVRTQERRVVVRREVAVIDRPLRQRDERKIASQNWPYRVLPYRAPCVPQIKFHIRPVDGLDVYMIEMDPKIIKIYEQDGHPDKINRFLSFPYSHHMVLLFNNTFAGYFVYFSGTPTKNLQSFVSYAPLSNLDSTGCTCFGAPEDYEKLNYELAALPSVRAKLARVVRDFFASTFTDHLRKTQLEPWARIEKRFRTYKEWEKATRLNPDFILSVPWQARPAGTVERVMNYAWRR
jgi:hypothetical protein